MFLSWIKCTFLCFVLYEVIGLRNVFCLWFYLSFVFLIFSVFINILGLIFPSGVEKERCDKLCQLVICETMLTKLYRGHLFCTAVWKLVFKAFNNSASNAKNMTCKTGYFETMYDTQDYLSICLYIWRFKSKHVKLTYHHLQWKKGS